MIHPARLSLLSRILRGGIVAIAVLASTVMALLLLDRVHRPARPVDPGIAAIDTTQHGRLVIIHVDSWRYETATDSTLMPRVAALRRAGASWKMLGVYEGFTIPAVRAAFSGHAETQLVNLIQNFSFRALPIESFFLDAARLGKRTLVVAREPFTQFGPYFTERFPAARGLDMYATDRERPAIAMRGYVEEGYDVVVLHYESADWVAHEVGIHAPRYRAEFSYADSLIDAFARVRRPQDYLLVYGDHGHSASGEHKTGIDIPTFGLLLGPDVTAGADAGPLAMTNLRYLASHALGITLRSASYDIPRLARAVPAVADTLGAAAPIRRGWSHAPPDYLLAAAVCTALSALTFLLLGRIGGTSASAIAWTPVGGALVLEVIAQRWLGTPFSVAPVLLIVMAFTARSVPWWQRVVVMALSALAALLGAGAWGGPTGAVPAGLAAVVTLYSIGITAKLVVLMRLVGVARWRRALTWTAVLTLLQLRVWDHPAAAFLVAAAGVWSWRAASDVAARRFAGVVLAQALLLFTLRQPIYQMFYIDLFLCVVQWASTQRDDPWLDVVLATGAFMLTCTWTASSLEWGFLYTVVPAHLVELQVQFFLPFILAKIPLVLILGVLVTGRASSQRLVAMLVLATGVRIAAAFMMRLSGASAADSWPLAEHAAYLSTFIVAAVWLAPPTSARFVQPDPT